MKKNSTTSISIVMPLYNAKKYIKTAMKSVLNQTFTDWELIVVDDCSTDNPDEIIYEFLQKDSRIKFIKLKKNFGPAVARNVGIDIAEGKYLAFLDADDIWKRNKLERQINFMTQNNISFSFTGYEFADENGNSTNKIVEVPNKMTYKMSLKNTIISTPSVIIDLEKVGKANSYMPNVSHEDSATWWKILKQGHIAYGLNESLYYYRRSPKTLSSNKIKSMKMKWNLYRKYEKMAYPKSIFYFSINSFNALKKRL